MITSRASELFEVSTLIDFVFVSFRLYLQSIVTNHEHPESVLTILPFFYLFLLFLSFPYFLYFTYFNFFPDYLPPTYRREASTAPLPTMARLRFQHEHSIKGILQRKLTGVKNKLKREIFIRRWGAEHFYILKGHHFGFCQEPFAAV
jgi:hypothetical protein